MHSTALFRELSTTLGLESLEFNAQNNLTLCFDGLHNITACLHAEDHAVIFYAVVGSAAPLAQEGVAMKLLQCSLLGADTGGGALSVYAPAQTVMLWKRHDDNFASVDALRQALESFLAELVRWKQIWADGTLTTAQETSDMPTQASSHAPGQAPGQAVQDASIPTTDTPHSTADSLPQFGLRV